MGNDRLDVSAAQAESLNERAVALDVGVLQVVQQATTLTDEQQQSAAAVVVVLVLLQVTGEVRNAAGEQGYLDLGRSRVAVIERVLLDDVCTGHVSDSGGSSLLRHFSPEWVSLHGAPGQLAKTWFASVLRDGFALSIHRAAPAFEELAETI